MERATALDRPRLVQTLTTLLDAAMPRCAGVTYRLVGTGAALLHGVDLPAADIDLLVRERRDVHMFAEALAAFPCLEAPAWLAGMRQYYANYEVDGVEVGISTVEMEAATDTVETFGPGPWQHYVLLTCGKHQVPTVTLELRLITELGRNRPDRYRPIIAHLRAYGCDCALLRRGMEAAAIAPALQEYVHKRLAA